ncbi:unnamed protein product, partial [Mesorhabditis spiculigera]
MRADEEPPPNDQQPKDNPLDRAQINLEHLMKYTVNVPTEVGNPKQPTVSRQEKVLNQEEFDKKHQFRRCNFTLARQVYGQFKRYRHQSGKEWWHWVCKRMPILHWLPSYQWSGHLMGDMFGGLMVAIMGVPQDLAYAMLVGVPPVYGLFTQLFCSLFYAIFGSSKHTASGPFSIVALMVGTLVSRQDASLGTKMNNSTEVTGRMAGVLCCTDAVPAINEHEAVWRAAGITLLVGIFQLILGVMNAGVLAVWLSDYLVVGLTTGAAIHVVISQMKSMTGVRAVPPSSESVPWGLAKFLVCFFRNITQAELPVCICSAICIALLLISSYVIDPLVRKKWKAFKMPMELLLVSGATSLNYFFHQHPSWGIKLHRVGYVANGFVRPSMPDLSGFEDWWADAFLIAIVSFTIHISLAKLVSKQHKYSINPNQEWLALGLMHTVSAPFGCFAGGSSMGRTMMLANLGTHSQMSAFVTAAIVLVVILWAAKLIEYLPKAVLAVIVAMSMKDLLLQVFRSWHILRLSTTDFLIYFMTVITTVFYGVTTGLVVGVSFALLTVIFRSQWPESTCMGRVPGTSAEYKGLYHYKLVLDVEGIIIFRFDAPLYFANVETFTDKLHHETRIDPILLRSQCEELERKKEKHGFWNRRSSKDAQHPERVPLVAAAVKQQSKLELLDEGKPEKLEKKESPPGPRHVEENHSDGEAPLTHLTHIVIDCSCINYVDLMGKDALLNTYLDYQTIGIKVLFANVKAYVRQFIEAADFHKSVPKAQFFVSIGDAVKFAEAQRAEEQQKQKATPTPSDPKTMALPNPKSPSKSQLEIDLTTAMDKNSLAETQPFSPTEQAKTQQEAIRAKQMLRREPSVQKTQIEEPPLPLDKTM